MKVATAFSLKPTDKLRLLSLRFFAQHIMSIWFRQIMTQLIWLLWHLLQRHWILPRHPQCLCHSNSFNSKECLYYLELSFALSSLLLFCCDTSRRVLHTIAAPSSNDGDEMLLILGLLCLTSLIHLIATENHRLICWSDLANIWQLSCIATTGFDTNKCAQIMSDICGSKDVIYPAINLVL